MAKLHYKCLYCTYECKLFNDMTRHLTKIKPCAKTLDGYNYTDEEVLKLSLLQHNIDKNILNKNNKYTVTKDKYFEIFNEIEKKKLRKCSLCNKSFTKKCELKKHVIIECVNIDDVTQNTMLNDTKNNIKNLTVNNHSDCSNNKTINNTTNSNNNNVTNNYNININVKSPISFDEDWDDSHLSHDDKILIVLSVLKYKKTLISLLNNKNNHNVIIDKNSNSGLVYKNNNIEVMSLNEICDRSIDKLNNQLNAFIEEIKNNDKNDTDMDYINHSKKIVRLEHSNYKYYENDRNNTNKNIIDTFNKVKDETLENFNEITKNRILNGL